MKKEIKIGTRGSRLALRQANLVAEELKRHNPGLAVSLVEIKTTGDKILSIPLAALGGKGLFVKEIEEALLGRDVDLAVHSMKDLPAELPEGLAIGAVPERADPRDALIARGGLGLESLPPGSKIGTSSLRRQSQLLNLRPNLKVIPMRGNLDTRLRKLRQGVFDAIVLAAAGLDRMGLSGEVTEYLDPRLFLPAVGQGALCLEVRLGDTETSRIVGKLNHLPSHVAVAAERALLKRLQGGCQVPVAALGCLKGSDLTLTGMVASIDGSKKIVRTACGGADEPEKMGDSLALELLEAGGAEILSSILSSLSSAGEED